MPSFHLARFIRISSSLALVAIAPDLLAGAPPARRDAPLPIHVQHLGTGRVTSARAHEAGDRLYVAGGARLHPLQAKAHVDILLVGAEGRVIAGKPGEIHPQRPAPGGGRRHADTYVASFPLQEARQATEVRVIYRSGPHSSCPAFIQG